MMDLKCEASVALGMAPAHAAKRLGPGRRRLCSLMAAGLLFGMTAASPALAATGYEKKLRPTPTPTVNRTGDLQKQREVVYEGYAKLFILGHVLTHVLGMGDLLPQSINLDIFAEQPYLAEAGDVFIYRGASRGDIMWPLILPTPPHESPTPIPTDTPTPERAREAAATPTLTPTPTPTEVVPPPLKLQAVSLSAKGGLVMISDIMLAVGDEIDGSIILEIHKGYATISYYGKNFMVTAKGTVRPEDFREEDLLLE